MYVSKHICTLFPGKVNTIFVQLNDNNINNTYSMVLLDDDTAFAAAVDDDDICNLFVYFTIETIIRDSILLLSSSTVLPLL